MRKADNLPPSCAVVTKFGNLNFLEPSGPVQACNGTALPLPLPDDLVNFCFFRVLRGRFCQPYDKLEIKNTSTDPIILFKRLETLVANVLCHICNAIEKLILL